MINKLLIFIILLLLLFSCQSKRDTEVINSPSTGQWRGIIHTQGQELPFNFSLIKNDTDQIQVSLINGEEKIPIRDVQIRDDSIFIPMHIFDADLVASFNDHEMTGYWRKNYAEDYLIPFTAQHGETFRFIDQPGEVMVNIQGRWEVYFENSSGKKLAVGEFYQNGSNVRGTFLRPSGDYRFLVGEVDGNQLYMSTFDGEHAYLFTATIDGDQMNGDFFSGKTRHDTWSAVRNDEIKLADAHSLTYLKDGYEMVDFSLPDMNGNAVSLQDPKYQNKVIIIQIFGSWCPNCMDETKFLSEWYLENKSQGVEIIAIAFERKDDLNYARTRIEKLKKRFNVQYDFLFGGKSDKTYTRKALPMLEGSISFPTMIVIDRSKKVRDIHTGFSGPGTGAYYDTFVKEFNILMEEILAE
jgi:thiol-disulfide isomerase/thioredoxin